MIKKTPRPPQHRRTEAEKEAARQAMADSVAAYAAQIEKQITKRAEELLRQSGYVPDPKGADGWVKASEIAKPKMR